MDFPNTHPDPINPFHLSPSTGILLRPQVDSSLGTRAICYPAFLSTVFFLLHFYFNSYFTPFLNVYVTNFVYLGEPFTSVYFVKTMV